MLPYLIRRLLENGTNSSFVNMINDSDVPAEQLAVDPLEKAQKFEYLPHPKIPLPVDLFLSEEKRRNSLGLNTSDSLAMSVLNEEVKAYSDMNFRATPIINGEDVEGEAPIEIFSPADLSNKVGEVSFATSEQVEISLNIAKGAFGRTYKTASQTNSASQAA